jgi:hypothetical protein
MTKKDVKDDLEAALSILASLGHQEVDMGVEINFLSERLDDGHNPRAKLGAGRGPQVGEECLNSRLAERAQEPALALEENAQHLGNREDNLAVGDIQKECLPHPAQVFDRDIIKAAEMGGMRNNVGDLLSS